MFRGSTLAPRVRAWHGGVCACCPFPAFSVGSPIPTPRPTNKNAATGRMSGESPITCKEWTETIRDGADQASAITHYQPVGGRAHSVKASHTPPTTTPRVLGATLRWRAAAVGEKYPLSKILSAKQNGIMRYHATTL